MPARALPQHTDRPGTDELVMRYRLAGRGLAPVEAIVPCATTDPEVFHPEHQSGVRVAPYKAEKLALAVCEDCPLMTACLVSDMRGAASVFNVRGVRAGLRQSERRALYLALDREGLL
ncbi:WhiB family transcriptional regulator [Streptomyces goshikiensis]|uniref:WhiB family transcriptional regulator n=1 Tax=Streptomyces goshikiensis TaxID=1942 RepID=UPI003668728E